MTVGGCPVRTFPVQAGLALAGLLILPALANFSQLRAAYAPVKCPSRFAVRDGGPGLRPWHDAEAGAGDSLSDLGDGSGSGDGDKATPPASPLPSPLQFQEPTQPGALSGGGMTPTSSGGTSGATTGLTLGLSERPEILRPQTCSWLSLSDPLFIPSPTLSGLFRPPRHDA